MTNFSRKQQSEIVHDLVYGKVDERDVSKVKIFLEAFLFV